MINRREIIELVGVAFGGFGFRGYVQPVDADPLPLFLTISIDEHLSPKALEALQAGMKPIQDHIKQQTGAKIPIVVLHAGINIDVVTDPRS